MWYNKYHKLFSGYIQHNNFEGQISIENADFLIATLGGYENRPLILESITDWWPHLLTLGINNHICTKATLLTGYSQPMPELWIKAGLSQWDLQNSWYSDFSLRASHGLAESFLEPHCSSQLFLLYPSSFPLSFHRCQTYIMVFLLPLPIFSYSLP